MKLHYTTKTFIIFIYYINVLYIKASPPKCETTDWDGNIYIKIIYKLKHLQRQRVVKQYNFQSINIGPYTI